MCLAKLEARVADCRYVLERAKKFVSIATVYVGVGEFVKISGSDVAASACKKVCDALEPAYAALLIQELETQLADAERALSRACEDTVRALNTS